MPKMGYCKPGLEPTEHPTMKDIYWAAGLCEGEASFCKHPAKENSERVQLPQAEDNKEILEKMQKLFGGSVYIVQKGDNNGYTQNQYRWVINGSRARGFMMTIFSLMSSKRKSQILKAFNKE